MKVLRKIIDCKSLETSQKNAYYGVYFSKVTSLQCTEYNSAGILFRKTICLKKNLLRKNSMVDQSFIKF